MGERKGKGKGERITFVGYNSSVTFRSNFGVSNKKRRELP